MSDTFPGDALGATEQLRDELEDRQRELVWALRGVGESWDTIARGIGISRQGLQGRVATWEKAHRVMEPAGR